MTHRSRSSRPRLWAVFGLAGLIIAMIAWAAPGAVAATRHSATAYAGHPNPGRNLASSPAAQKAPGAAKPTVKCDKPGTSHSIQVGTDLSDVHPSAKWTKKTKTSPAKLVFDLKTTPRFSLNLDFSGDVKCEADLTLAKFPIGDTGLVLEIGPKLEFTATGEVSADFTWKPAIQVGFTVSATKISKGPLSFTNGTGVVFTGSGKATLRLDLHAVIETVGGAVGVEGDIGPTLTAKVTGTTATDTACWNADVAADADFDTFINAFGFEKKFFSHEWQLGKAKTFNGCLSKTIIFVGTPGINAPPTTLGPHTMAAFAPDSTPLGTAESQIAGPTGTVTFNPALIHATIGNNWATWSNGYTGDVYYDTTPLPDGNFQITVTLPAGTGAFYAYAEPNEFKDYAINATANNGVTSGDVTVNGDGGARYFGFYATCGHTLKSVTYVDSGGDTAMAIGEFGIAPAC
jgi:hypothetical protein